QGEARANSPDLIIPPKFTKKLKKMDSIKGSFVHLECIVSGSHPISIQWYKDGQEITASEKHKYSFHDNTAFLEINKLEGTDSGSYTCEATNKAGSSESCSIELKLCHVNKVATLKLTNVDLSHRGRYTCQAKNESGVEKCFGLLFLILDECFGSQSPLCS
uniref:Ig-like domain-containing protein n=1 Tax=Anser brachyrhynchus TaxID=132585 RepID=A0A8B9BHT5_9AVES